MVASVLAPAVVRAQNPSPSPPPWQTDLVALQALRVTATLTPDARNAQGETLAAHLKTAFAQLGAKYPDRPEVQRACGDFYFDTGETGRGFEYWLRAQKLAPHDAELAAVLGDSYLKMGNVRAAMSQLQHAVEIRPDEPRYHTALGTVLHTFRHELIAPPAVPDAETSLRLALEQYRLATQFAPGNRQTAQTYAEAFYILAKPDWLQALLAWQTVLTLSGTDTDFANSHLARVNLRMKRPREARLYLERLRGPQFKDLQAKLGAQADRMEAAGVAIPKD